MDLVGVCLSIHVYGVDMDGDEKKYGRDVVPALRSNHKDAKSQ